MTLKRNNSFSDYATRRFNLAGGRLLANHNPFCRATDLMRESSTCSEPLLSFAHYDYLGLADHPAVRSGARIALDQHGPGVGASRLVGGERRVHRKVEQQLASLLGVDDALTLVSGYGTNASLISHVMTSGDLIVYDSYSHNSIVAGTRGSRATCIAFEHNDLQQLEALLRVKRVSYGRVLVVVEGLYSMDGDIPDLPKLLAICRRYDAWLMIDEAHSIGVLGPTGRGITEHFGVDPTQVDLIVGTLSKAFASCGGFIAGKSAVVRWLRYTLPGFVFSVGLPATIVGGVSAAIDVMHREPERVAALQAISERFASRARELDFDVGTAIGAGVVPVMLPSIEATMDASAWLMQSNIYVPPIVQLAVPKDQPRLRFFLSSKHTEVDVERVLQTLVAWRSGWVEPADNMRFAFAQGAPVAAIT